MEEEKIEKEGKNKSQHIGFVYSKCTWLSSLCIQNLKCSTHRC